METIKKRVDEAFGKKIYLLGVDKDNKNVWLEAPKWDCGWYWGLGYIERYTNNKNPSMARNILSHTHWDSEIIGQHEYYDSDKKCFRLNSDYIHHFNDNSNFLKTVLTEHESWELADLMKSFYTLRDTAGLYHQGNSGVAKTEINLKDLSQEKKINEVKLPAIFKRISEILTPQPKKEV